VRQPSFLKSPERQLASEQQALARDAQAELALEQPGLERVQMLSSPEVVRMD